MLTISVTENKPGWRGAVDGGDYDTGWEPILGDLDKDTGWEHTFRAWNTMVRNL